MRASISALLLFGGTACVEAARELPWPESESVVRVLVRVTDGGGLEAEIAHDAGPSLLRDGETMYLLSLRSADLLSLHPHVSLARAKELRLEPRDPVCEVAYARDVNRVYGPVPATALWHWLDSSSDRFEVLSAFPEALRGLRLSMPFEEARSRPPGHLEPFGLETRVTMDGWSVKGVAQWVDRDPEIIRHHRIQDVQALGEGHVLIAHIDRLFVFERGAPALSSDLGLVQLQPQELATAGDDADWSFTSFAILPERTASGAWRVIAASSKGDGAERRSRFSWLEVESQPPSFRVVASSTVAGGTGSFAGEVDPYGRALFLVESSPNVVPRHERRAAVLVGPEPPLSRVVPESTEVFAFVTTTPLEASPHAVLLEDGRVWLTDFGTTPLTAHRESRLPRLTGQGVASMATSLDESSRLRIVIGGEVGAFFLFDPAEDRWWEPSFIAAEATERTAGCVAASVGEGCGLSFLGRELRDAQFHQDSAGRLWTLMIPQVCRQILAAEPGGVLTGWPLESRSGPGRLLTRLRPSWTPSRKLVATAEGELFELELD